MQAAIAIPHTITETSGPRFSPTQYPPVPDMSVVDGHAAMGERIIVRGRITDEDGRPVPRTLIEIWQANAAGRYQHPSDQHDAPLDPRPTPSPATARRTSPAPPSPPFTTR